MADDPTAQLQREIAALKEKLKKISAECADTTLTKYVADNNKKMPTLLNPPKLRRVLKGHSGKVSSMQWSEEKTNSTLASAALDGKILVWDGVTTNKLKVIPLKSNWVMACGYTSQHSLIASGGLENVVSVYDIRSHPIRLIRELVGHDGFITSCKFIDNTHLLTSSGDYACALWDITTGQMVRSFSGVDGHSSEVMALSLSPDKSVFVSGSADSTAKLWDIKSGKCIYTFYGHQSDVNSLCFFPNGLGFSTGSDDCKAILWDIRALAELTSFADDSIHNGITSLAHSISGHYLFAAYDDNSVRVWDTLTATSLHQFNVHHGKVSCIGVSADGAALCTGSWDYNLKIWV